MMKKIVNKKFCVIYDDLKLIKSIVSVKDNVLFSKWNVYGTNTYNQFKTFVNDNNLYFDNTSKIKYNELEKIQKNITTTLFKYDD